VETEVHSRINNFTKQLFCTYKHSLSGLPSFCRLLMLEIFEYYDQSTDIITITSLDKLARDHFQVDAERGRQKENINGDTLRNAFRTIKKFKSDYFQFTKVNQKIVIDMPFMRQLHQSFFNETQEVSAIVVTDVAEATTLAQYGAQASLPPILATDVATELAEADVEDAFNAHAIKPNKIKPNNNNNAELEEFGGIKKPISDDFYPSQFAIEKALSLGFSKAAASDEIKKFILFNQANGSLWRNYDYVYIMWAQSVVERAQKAKSEAFKPKQVYSRSESNERHQTPSERVIELFTKGGGLEFNQTTRRFNLPAGHQPAPVRVLSFNDLGSID
jgi:hypothetical protein